MWKTILAISLGATLGALMRWRLGSGLSTVFPSLPPGTLVANLIGGYIVGVAIAWFALAPNIAPEWRLFLITGFCGGLTTFSTFSAETVTLFLRQQYAWAITTVSAHLLGSLAMTLAGLFLMRLLLRA